MEKQLLPCADIKIVYAQLMDRPLIHYNDRLTQPECQFIVDNVGIEVLGLWHGVLPCDYDAILQNLDFKDNRQHVLLVEGRGGRPEYFERAREGWYKAKSEQQNIRDELLQYRQRVTKIRSDKRMDSFEYATYWAAVNGGDCFLLDADDYNINQMTQAGINDEPSPKIDFSPFLRGSQ